MSTRLLTQNSELRRVGVHNWTIPAFIVTLSNGTRFNACPHAGPCARVCYARFNTYRFPIVAAAHLRNLEMVLDDPTGWAEAMTAEVGSRRVQRSVDRSALALDGQDAWVERWIAANGPAVRIHDAGDFFARWYLDLWLEIAVAYPLTLFYAYTKEVSLLRSVETLPPNFRIVFSLGGTEDHLVDRDADRHAEVFSTLADLETAGYVDQADNDLLAVVHPSKRIGIVANNIPQTRIAFRGRRMSEITPHRTGAP